MKALIIILWAILVGCFVMLVKNNVTYNHLSLISSAICLYNLDMISQHKERVVDFDDMRSYDVVLFRIWDWGYKHILPPDKFAIIEPYIDK